MPKKPTEELRSLIATHLAACSKVFSPKITEMIQTEQGYLKIEELIISTMLAGKLTVGAAIAQVEMELE